MMKCLDDIQQALLLRVPVRPGVAPRQVLVQVVQAVTEARCESEGVEDTVEEAGVAKVSKAGNARTVGPPITPTPTIHTGLPTTSLSTFINI